MMHGFGDEQPSAQTALIVEDMLVKYIVDVCQEAQRVASNRGKVRVEDFKYALRNDEKKLGRVEELLYMTEEIARARGRKDDLAAYGEE